MNAAKRRRLDESSSTLSKPFRSPMLKKQPPYADDPAAQSTPLKSATSIEQPLDSPPPKLSLQCPTFLPKPVPQTQASTSSSTRPNPSRPLHPATLAKNHDLSYLTLQKQHSALLLRLSHLHTSLDTAQQAVKITSSSTDTKLSNLISKWRTASREAAEELFGSASDRVNKMGGFSAWREQMKEQSKGGWGDDNINAEERNQDGSTLSEAQKEARAIMLEDMKAEMEKYGEKQEEVLVEDDEERDDEKLTMDMMLKHLNIDLQVIGYSKAHQRWV